MTEDIAGTDAKKKTDPPERKDPENLDKDAQAVMMEALKNKKAEIDEQLNQIEKRNKEFRDLVDELKMSGKGSVRAHEVTEEEKARQAAKNLIAGSGFEDRLEL